MNQGDPVRGSLSRFRDGLLLLVEGGRFLRRERRLWGLASIPILFATILLGLAVSIFAARLDVIHEALSSLLPTLEATNWWTWLWVGPGKALLWILGWTGVVLTFAFSLVAALLAANLLSAPFLDQLSQRVESIVTGADPSGATGFTGILTEALRSFGAELQRLTFFVVIWVVLGMTGFVVPGAHLVTGPVLIAATVILLPLDYAGFALDRRQIPFRSRRDWLRANWPTMSGFGGVAFLACLVPGLNLLILPALVTAGTLLVLRVPPSSPESSRNPRYAERTDSRSG